MPPVTRRPIWLFLAVLISAAIFVFMRVDKYLITAYLRTTAPKTIPAPAEPPTKQEFLFDFANHDAGGSLASDLKGAKLKESFFQLDSPHVLNLVHLAATPFQMRSFGTFVEYKYGRFDYLVIKIAAEPMTYGEALELVKTHTRILNIEDQVNVSDYARHLGPVEGAETWMPTVKFLHAELSITLHCNWEALSMLEAKAQLQTVHCRPTLNFNALESRSPKDAQ